MAEYWDRVRPAPAPGVIWMDPDIVADPGDVDAMRARIKTWPEWVAVGPHKLWPASTMRDDWVWGYGQWENGTPVMNQAPKGKLGWFAMGFTYTPRKLLDAALPEMPFWEFGQVDMGLSRLARAGGIEIQIVAWAAPKHMHYVSREGDASWHGPAGT